MEFGTEMGYKRMYRLCMNMFAQVPGTRLP